MSDETINFNEHFGIRIALQIGGVDIPGILDTGATTCCAPDSLLRQLEKQGHIKSVGKTTVTGAVTSQQVSIYRGNVKVRGLVWDGEEADIIGLPTSTALLGRNLLKYLNVSYDGPNSRATIHAGDSIEAFAEHEAEPEKTYVVQVDGKTVNHWTDKGKALEEFYDLLGNYIPENLNEFEPFEATISIQYDGKTVASGVTGGY